MGLYLGIYLFDWFIGVYLQDESLLFLVFLDYWDRLFIVGLPFVFDCLKIVVIPAWSLSSLGQSLYAGTLAAIQKEQVNQFNLNPNLLVPLDQVVFVPGKSINQENSFPTPLLDL